MYFGRIMASGRTTVEGIEVDQQDVAAASDETFHVRAESHKREHGEHGAASVVPGVDQCVADVLEAFDIAGRTSVEGLYKLIYTDLYNSIYTVGEAPCPCQLRGGVRTGRPCLGGSRDLAGMLGSPQRGLIAAIVLEMTDD
jgi:hypothetical protein